MGYYIRHFVAGDGPADFEEVRRAILSAAPGKEIQDEVLSCDGDDWAVVSLNLPGDGLFEAEIAEFEELVDEEYTWAAKRRLRKHLARCRAIIGFQVLSGGTEGSEATDRLEPAILGVARTWPGLTQVDGEGFYDMASVGPKIG